MDQAIFAKTINAFAMKLNKQGKMKNTDKWLSENVMIGNNLVSQQPKRLITNKMALFFKAGDAFSMTCFIALSPK